LKLMEGLSKKVLTSYSYPFTDSHDEDERERLFYEYWVLRRQPKMTFQKYHQRGEQEFGMGESQTAAPGPFNPSYNYNVFQLNQVYLNSGANTFYAGGRIRMLELEVRFRIESQIFVSSEGNIIPYTVGDGSSTDSVAFLERTWVRWTVWVVYDRSGWCKQNAALPEVGGIQGVLLQKKESSIIKEDWKENFLIVKQWSGTLGLGVLCATVNETVDLMGLPMGIPDDASTFADDLDYGCLFMMALFHGNSGVNAPNCTGFLSWSMAYADANSEFCTKTF